MRKLLLLAIRFYWKIPTRLHEKCIFRESCSHYVYRMAKEQGFIVGIRAFLERNDLCRPGYVIYRSEGRYYMQTASGRIIDEKDIAQSELPPENNNIIDLDQYNVEETNVCKIN